MLNDPLSNALINLKNYALSGKNDCIIKPASKLIKNVLQILQRENYIGSFEYIDDGKSGKFKVKLIGRINNCGGIKPRQPVKLEELESWEKKYLPARDFGLIILTTPYGVLTHKEAREKNTGGSLLAFVY